MTTVTTQDIVRDFSSEAKPLSSQTTSSTYLNKAYKLQDADNFNVYHNPEKQMSYFIEKSPEKTGKHHLVYVFSHKTGNLTYGHGGKWARSELNSNSAAFHKGDESKMPLSDNRNVVIERIVSHYKSHKPGSFGKSHCS